MSFAPPFNAPGALRVANVSSWPGVLNASECPQLSGVDCAGFELQDSAGGGWWPAQASLSVDGSELLLVARGAPAGAKAVASAYGQGVWPLASLFAGQGLGGLPAYPWAPAPVVG